MTPTLLVVSGLPAAGKTTLAAPLARSLGWPLVTKDDYKGLLYAHLPELPQAQGGPLSFALMFRVADVVLSAGGSAVLETHFHRGVSEPEILALAERSGARLGQVLCSARRPWTPCARVRPRGSRRAPASASTCRSTTPPCRLTRGGRRWTSPRHC
ncbi:AAA family ATPase [Deinococcus petrolearius]|uniref:AAA family ATPase n=1 Tax=Deinococcus petrolearius TaxID=1751295 RepID=A0ABW1DJ61_9DEIO